MRYRFEDIDARGRFGDGHHAPSGHHRGRCGRRRGGGGRGGWEEADGGVDGATVNGGVGQLAVHGGVGGEWAGGQIGGGVRAALAIDWDQRADRRVLPPADHLDRRRRQGAVKQQGLPGGHLTQLAFVGQLFALPARRHRTPRSPVLARQSPTRGTVTAFGVAGHMMVAEQRQDRSGGGRVFHPGEHDRGRMPGQDRVGLGAVRGVDLGDGLPRRDVERAEPGDGRHLTRQPREPELTGFVDHDHQRFRDRLRPDVPRVDLIFDPGQQATQHRGEPLEVPGVRRQIQRVQAGGPIRAVSHQPVQIDIARGPRPATGLVVLPAPLPGRRMRDRRFQPRFDRQTRRRVDRRHDLGVLPLQPDERRQRPPGHQLHLQIEAGTRRAPQQMIDRRVRRTRRDRHPRRDLFQPDRALHPTIGRTQQTRQASQNHERPEQTFAVTRPVVGVRDPRLRDRLRQTGTNLVRARHRQRGLHRRPPRRRPPGR